MIDAPTRKEARLHLVAHADGHGPDPDTSAIVIAEIELQRLDLTRRRRKAVWRRQELAEEIDRIDLALGALDWERRLLDKRIRAAAAAPEAASVAPPIILGTVSL